ncbi:caspase domain-containing protein [Armillaria nabsnona]|nr:caspase domain-containing protein [Armillaria nabsnona]
MFLDWLNITVTKVSHLLCPQTATDSSAKETVTLPSPQPNDDSFQPPPIPQAATDSPLAEKETLPSPQPYDDSSSPPMSQAATDSPAKETLPSLQPYVNPHPYEYTIMTLCFIVLLSVLPLNMIVRPTPPLFALVISIDEYADLDLHNLTGAVADADAVKDFLQKTLRVPEHQIKNLRNKDVTRVTIKEEIKNFGDNPVIKKGDPILIFYAGHGAIVNMPQGWPTGSADEKIQMLVPHDFNPNGSDNSKRGQGVLDVRLSHLLQDITDKKSDNITVILDCCHSGSGMRTDDNDQTFAVHGIDLPASYTVPNDLHLHDPGARADFVPERFKKAGLLSHVLLSACKAGQVAREIPTTGELKNDKIRSVKSEDLDPGMMPAVPTPMTPEQYILEAGEAHGITKNAEFVVFADRTKASESVWETQTALGTVVAVNTTAFTTMCNFSLRGDKTQRFTLLNPRAALQTQVGDGQDVGLFVELAPELLPVFEQIAKEMKSSEAAKRTFFLVDSHEDKPDLVITVDGNRIHFEIMHERWSPLAGKVNLECMKLKETGEYTDDLEEILMPDPNGHNLNVGGVIMVDVNEDAIYGFKITNTSVVPLYVWMFYFDISDLSISSYYQPGHVKKDVDFSLPPRDSLTIGYGTSGMVPHMYTLRKGQNVDVGFLKIFFLTEYMDLSGVIQRLPFEDVRHDVERRAKTPRYLWHTMCVPVVQTKGGGTS